MAISIGLLLGLTLLGVSLPVDPAGRAVPLWQDVIAAGVAVAAYSVFFSTPLHMLPWPVAVRDSSATHPWPAPADDAAALSRLEQRLTPVLSVIAGMVDLTSFLTLGNIFTAHITGNLVVIPAVLVRGGPLNLAQALAIPVFILRIVG